MSEFTPKGYERLTVCKERIGADQLRAELAAGDLVAYRWDTTSGRIQRLSVDEWLGYRADEFIRRGEWDNGGRYAHAYEELLLIKEPEQAPPKRPSSKKGGRPPKYDWDDFYCEVVRIANGLDGLPEKQGELEKAMLDWCSQHWNTEPGESTIRTKIARIYQKVKPGSET